jgi:hypothetical protein
MYERAPGKITVLRQSLGRRDGKATGAGAKKAGKCFKKGLRRTQP